MFHSKPKLFQSQASWRKNIFQLYFIRIWSAQGSQIGENLYWQDIIKKKFITCLKSDRFWCKRKKKMGKKTEQSWMGYLTVLQLKYLCIFMQIGDYRGRQSNRQTDRQTQVLIDKCIGNIIWSKQPRYSSLRLYKCTYSLTIEE